MNTVQDNQSAILQVSQEYESLLDQMESTTCELMAAIQEWDAQKVRDLADNRSSLCAKIGESIHQLVSLDPVNQMGKGASESTVYRRLEETIQRIQARQQETLSRQTETERALNAELRQRRPVLAEMNDRRGKQNAYRTTGTALHQPRFLDSKT